ncbi:hypothetical protein [Paenibacillus puerhi]|uniref:hypothetical protein n=1 Tax=Paenibacillus puerhi TaxID=2692622 RepID=UPI001358C2D6|nr:hypothetical protein [Paenibacillus puerhi]
MGRDIVDLSVTKHQASGEITLVLESYSQAALGLNDLPNGATVTLKNGRSEQKVRVIRGDGDECAFPYLEIDPAMAKSLGLRDQCRYLVDYNPMQDTVDLTQVIVSRSQALLEPDRYRRSVPHITIGGALAAALGIPRAAYPILTVRNGKSSAKVRLHVPENEISEELRLSASLCRKLGLVPGHIQQLAYNQRSKTLAIGNSAAVEAPIVAEPAGRPEDGPSSGLEPQKSDAASRSGKANRPGQATLSHKIRSSSGVSPNDSSAVRSIRQAKSFPRANHPARQAWSRYQAAGSRQPRKLAPTVSKQRPKSPSIWLSPQVTPSARAAR